MSVPLLYLVMNIEGVAGMWRRELRGATLGYAGQGRGGGSAAQEVVPTAGTAASDDRQG
eukprot:COSAG01_NODE_26496_length_712_cov_1.143556_1_plen_58_part_10